MSTSFQAGDDCIGIAYQYGHLHLEVIGLIQSLNGIQCSSLHHRHDDPGAAPDADGDTRRSGPDPDSRGDRRAAECDAGRRAEFSPCSLTSCRAGIR